MNRHRLSWTVAVLLCGLIVTAVSASTHSDRSPGIGSENGSPRAGELFDSWVTAGAEERRELAIRLLEMGDASVAVQIFVEDLKELYQHRSTTMPWWFLVFQTTTTVPPCRMLSDTTRTPRFRALCGPLFDRTPLP